MPAPLLELRNVTVIRGQRCALDSLSLEIAVGEDVAIIGPNGSGKSTLIKTILRECYPLADSTARGSSQTPRVPLCGTGVPCRQTTPGRRRSRSAGGAVASKSGRAATRFRIFGRETWNVFELRQRLGIVTDDLMRACTQEMTAEDIVVSGFFSSIGPPLSTPSAPQITGQMLDQVHNALEAVEADHLASRSMLEMSTGEARRVLIARALVHDPEALILDEPSNSLDLRAANELRAHLQRIAANGRSIIMVTHHVPDVLPDINRVILLKEGRIFKDGPKREVLTSENLSALFGLTLRLELKDGVYHLF